jgi:hypothetical protein
LSGSQYMYQKVDLFQSYRDHSPLRHPNQWMELLMRIFLLWKFSDTTDLHKISAQFFVSVRNCVIDTPNKLWKFSAPHSPLLSRIFFRPYFSLLILQCYLCFFSRFRRSKSSHSSPHSRDAWSENHITPAIQDVDLNTRFSILSPNRPPISRTIPPTNHL